jgi:hypothetical protein
MIASCYMGWLRCVLIAGLCYCLVGQTLLVQAAGIAAATADTQMVLCHGNGEPNPGDANDDPLAKCHFCWLPASGTALIPDANPGIAARVAIDASAYSFFSESFTVVRPPPRGDSRAPPHIA